MKAFTMKILEGIKRGESMRENTPTAGNISGIQVMSLVLTAGRKPKAWFRAWFRVFFQVAVAVMMLCGGLPQMVTPQTAPFQLQAQDWPAWRGPHGDGSVESGNWDPEALRGGADVLWRASVGQGFSGLTVRGNRVYTAGNDRNQDTVYAFNAANGSEVWSYSFSASRGSYPGPRAAPVLDGQYLYFLNRHGVLVCLRAHNGEEVWKRDLTRDFNAQSPGWGFAGAPVVAGDKLIINAGRAGMALDKNSGELLWSNGGGRGGYAAPVVFDHNRREYAALFAFRDLVIVDIRNGEEIASYSWQTGSDVNAADPLVKNNLIFITSGYGKGGVLLELTGRNLRQVWNKNNLASHFPSGVIVDDHLYSIDGDAGRRGGTLRCVHIESGRERWSRNVGFSSLIAVDDRLIVVNEQGDVIIIEANPDRYREVSRANGVVDARVWTPPSFSNGRLFLRNDRGEVIAIDLR